MVFYRALQKIHQECKYSSALGLKNDKSRIFPTIVSTFQNHVCRISARALNKISGLSSVHDDSLWNIKLNRTFQVISLVQKMYVNIAKYRKIVC